MEREYTYYNILLATSPVILSTVNMAEVCFSFGQLIQKLGAEMKSEVGEYFVALTQMHWERTQNCPSDDDARVQFPYSTKSLRTSEEDAEDLHYFVTYGIPKIPSKDLQGVILGYMLDCLASPHLSENLAVVQ